MTETPGVRSRPIRLSGQIPGLDVLRGAAVIAVVIFHGFANSGYHGKPSAPSTIFVTLAELGKLGIYLFFNLSGFLITSILLRQREKPRFYRNFYVRRALRILPAYLLMLFVLKISGLITWWFVAACVLFVANMAKLMHASATEYGVFWTLAVEEQFYLLWPTLVHRLRRTRTLLIAILAGCALAPVLRIVLSLHNIGTFLLLPTNMDALLYGSLCALLLECGVIHTGNIRRIVVVLFATGLVLLLPYVYVSCFLVESSPRFWAVWDAFGRFVPFCLFIGAVLLSVQQAQLHDRKARSPAARLFSFFGYVSYGLYLVHPLIFRLYDHIFLQTSLGASRTRFSMLFARFVTVGCVSLLLATLSRRYFEQLFLARKKELAPYASPALARRADDRKHVRSDEARP